jgi:Protein of Unknown function (DUF2784)
MALLANAVLVVHAAFVIFVAGGLLAIWIGAWRNWRWVRDFRFRVVHLSAIGFVALEAAIGMACPLTVIEDRLRGAEYESGFLERWLHRILYWDFPAWTFTIAYLAFAAAAALTFLRFPPRRHRGG